MTLAALAVGIWWLFDRSRAGLLVSAVFTLVSLAVTHLLVILSLLRLLVCVCVCVCVLGGGGVKGKRGHVRKLHSNCSCSVASFLQPGNKATCSGALSELLTVNS